MTTPKQAYCPLCRTGPFRTYERPDGSRFFYCQACRIEVSIDGRPFMPIEELMEGVV